MQRPKDPIERRKGLSAEEFHRNFLEPNRPVILTDQVERWPASTLWSDDYLTRRFGDRPVEAVVHGDGIYTAHRLAHEKTTLGALLASRHEGGPLRSLVVQVLSRAPYLIEDYSVPTVVRPEEVESSGFWVKPGGAKSGLHFDHQDGLLGVIRGRKRLLMFSPDQVDRLYPCPVRDVGESARRNWSEVVDIFHPDAPKEYPLLEGAACHEAIVEAGEMLFLPKFWWHAVDNQADLTLSVNFFLAVRHDRPDPPRPLFYEDRVLIEQLLVNARALRTRRKTKMYSIRQATGPHDFELAGAPPADAAPLLARGATRPEWCLLLARDGVDVGRAGLYVEPTCPPEFLGRLPAREASLFGLWLPWHDADWLDAGRFLIKNAIERTRREVPEPVQATVNREAHDHVDERLELFEALGMTLFQEKQGFAWKGGVGESAPGPGRLSFRTLDEVGHDLYRRTLARAGESTLDRNDAWYRELAGEDNWAGVFMSFAGPEDGPTWLLASLPGGEPVGVAAVSPFDATTATIVFIGVVPKHRGKGYVDELLCAATAAARKAGFGEMLSDADVVNAPMAAAFERNGHSPHARPWHKWHYRF